MFLDLSGSCMASGAGGFSVGSLRYLVVRWGPFVQLPSQALCWYHVPYKCVARRDTPLEQAQDAA